MSPSAAGAQATTNTVAASHSAHAFCFTSGGLNPGASALGGIGFQAPVAHALAIGGGVLVREGALPDLLEIGGQLQLVRVADGERAQLAAGVLLLYLAARLLRLVVLDQDCLLVHRAAHDFGLHQVSIVVKIIR